MGDPKESYFESEEFRKKGMRPVEVAPGRVVPHTEETLEEKRRVEGRQEGDESSIENIGEWFSDTGTEREDEESLEKRAIINDFNALSQEVRLEIVKQLQDEARLGHLNDEEGKFAMDKVLDRARFLVDRNVEIMERKGWERKHSSRS